MAIFNRRKNRQEKLIQEQKLGAPLITYMMPQSVQAEQIRTIRTNVEFAQVDRQLKSLLVTSSIPAEGKSTVSVNLALAMGQTDKRVLLVDADLRKPIINRTFRISNEQGLTSLLVNNDLQFNQVVQKSSDLNLYIMPSGPIPPNPSELLGSAKMASLIKELENHFDLIIYDVPPMNAVTDAQIMASRTDGVLLVVRNGYVRREEVRTSVDRLKTVDANVLGYVMNGVSADDSKYSYGYGYGYGYGEDEN